MAYVELTHTNHKHEDSLLMIKLVHLLFVSDNTKMIWSRMNRFCHAITQLRRNFLGRSSHHEHKRLHHEHASQTSGLSVLCSWSGNCMILRGWCLQTSQQTTILLFLATSRVVRRTDANMAQLAVVTFEWLFIHSKFCGGVSHGGPSMIPWQIQHDLGGSNVLTSG